MPIPKDGHENPESMKGEGWHRELTLRRVEVIGGIPHLIEYDYYADKIPCKVREGGRGPPCGTDHVWIKNVNGKIYWCCAKHRIAQGPITTGLAHQAEKKAISAVEAQQICRQTGQIVPSELAGLVSDESVRTKGIRKRPKDKA